MRRQARPHRRRQRRATHGPPTGDEFELYVELNEAFHNELFVLADSDVLRDAYERVLALPFAQPSFFLPAQADTSQFEPTLAAGNAGHHEILNAIERGDSDEADRLARAHAQLTVKNLEAVLETGRSREAARQRSDQRCRVGFTRTPVGLTDSLEHDPRRAAP